MNGPSDILAAMRGAFAQAAAANPDQVAGLSVRLAGRPALFRVAGASLGERTLAPLRHLFDPSPPPESGLTVELWDEEETGVPFPIPGSRNAATGQPART